MPYKAFNSFNNTIGGVTHECNLKKRQAIYYHCAGDVLATWQPETQADLDWLEHCPGCQEVTMDIQEVQE